MWLLQTHKKTVSLCKTPLYYFILPSGIPSPYSIPPHACPPLILSYPMQTLPLFYPTPCMPSPYSIPPYSCPPLTLSQPMHDLPLFYPTSCTPSTYSIPLHACPLPILSYPMHALSLFYPNLCMPFLYFIPLPCMPSPYSIPAHVCPLPILPSLHMPPQYSILFYSLLFQPRGGYLMNFWWYARLGKKFRTLCTDNFAWKMYPLY